MVDLSSGTNPAASTSISTPPSVSGPCTSSKPVTTSTVSNNSVKNETESVRKLSGPWQRKLDQPQNLTSPDIVTWLPVLLTTTSHSAAAQPRTPKLPLSSCEVTTPGRVYPGDPVEAPNGELEGKVAVVTEDGLVYRSPEMKRSLQRNKKKKLSKKKRVQDPPTVTRTNNNNPTSSTDESDNSDSFYETLRRHQRQKRASTKSNSNKK